MRAGLTLDALAAKYAVHLVVVPVSDPHPVVTPFVARRTARVHVVDPSAAIDTHAALIARVSDPAEYCRHRIAYARPWMSRLASPRAIAAVSDWAAETPLASVHIMRLHLAPFVEAIAGRQPRPVRVLDLDDDEMQTHASLAALHEGAGETALASLARAEATSYARFAERWFSRFDSVLTAAEPDAARLAANYPAARFDVFPNGYPAIARPPARARPADADVVRVLFVGTLGYPPNADAVRFLCRDILPHLRRVTADRVRIELCGGGATRDVARLAEDPAVIVHGHVADLAPCYAAADVAAVPLRAGGGTRIKILEAFAHRVPVVATTIGAAGLAVRPDHDILCADSASNFAEACVMVARDATRAAALRDAGTDLMRTHYGAITVRELLARLHHALGEGSDHAERRHAQAGDGRRT
jgi:glycosyltransferase involved in cell wall biosynthesis